MPVQARLEAPGSARDSEAFAAFYREHSPHLRRYCAYRFGRERADDVCQQTMERALRSFQRFDLSREAWPWLRVVARNIALNDLRHSDHCEPVDDLTPFLGPADVAPDPADAAESDHVRACVATALARLAEGQRRVLLMRLRDELELTTIAELLGSTENAVRQQLFKARRAFMSAYQAVTSASAALLPAGLLTVLFRRLRRAGAAPIQAAALGVSLVTAAAFVGGATELPAQSAPRIATLQSAAGADRPAAASVVSRVVRTTPTRPAAHTPAPTHLALRAVAAQDRPMVTARVSRHPLAPGQVAAVTVDVTTPAGTVYYRDTALSGHTGPACATARSLCS